MNSEKEFNMESVRLTEGQLKMLLAEGTGTTYIKKLMMSAIKTSVSTKYFN